MAAPPSVGLPYGSIPRLLLAWITTEAVRTKSRELVLGDHLSGFMRQLRIIPTGGRWGTIGRLRTQMERLFSTSIWVRYKGENVTAGTGWMVADDYQLWWGCSSRIANATRRPCAMASTTVAGPTSASPATHIRSDTASADCTRACSRPSAS